jgi:hypothetical protein
MFLNRLLFMKRQGTKKGMGKCKPYYLLIPFNIVLGLSANYRQRCVYVHRSFSESGRARRNFTEVGLACRSFTKLGLARQSFTKVGLAAKALPRWALPAEALAKAG